MLHFPAQQSWDPGKGTPVALHLLCKSGTPMWGNRGSNLVVVHYKVGAQTLLTPTVGAPQTPKKLVRESVEAGQESR